MTMNVQRIILTNLELNMMKKLRRNKKKMIVSRRLFAKKWKGGIISKSKKVMKLGQSPQKKNGGKRKLKPMAKRVNTTTTTQNATMATKDTYAHQPSNKKT